jgi:shikimate kinase
MEPARTLDPVERVLAAVDPRLARQVGGEFDRAGRHPPRLLRSDARWVLAGHRAAGKSTLLPLIAQLCGRRAVDLDVELERQRGAPIRDWYGADPAGFRAAERAVFSRLPSDVLVAVGGGFLSHHPDLLQDAEVILVPLSFDTYRERLLADHTRPRLHPELSLEEELRRTWEERERAHAAVPTLTLSAALAALGSGGRP